jgi:hypothetical protein
MHSSGGLMKYGTKEIGGDCRICGNGKKKAAGIR